MTTGLFEPFGVGAASPIIRLSSAVPVDRRIMGGRMEDGKMGSITALGKRCGGIFGSTMDFLSSLLQDDGMRGSTG